MAAAVSYDLNALAAVIMTQGGVKVLDAGDLVVPKLDNHVAAAKARPRAGPPGATPARA